MMTLWLLLQHIHASRGPYGIVAWVEPPQLAAGIELVRGHLTAWFEMVPATPGDEHVYYWHAF